MLLLRRRYDGWEDSTRPTIKRDAGGSILRIAAVKRAGAVQMVRAAYRGGRARVEDGLPYAPPPLPGGGWDKDIPIWESMLEPVDGGGSVQTKEQCARIRAAEYSSDFNRKLGISIGLHAAAIVVEFIIGLAIEAVVSGATVFTLSAPVGYAIAGVIIATTLSGLNDYAQLKVDFDRCVENATRDCAGLP